MTDTENGNGKPISQPSRTKKPYSAPQLVRWGTMRDITLSTGFHGNNDGAKRGSNKTA